MNRDVTITQTDVTLRRNDRPIELTQASAEIVAVGVAGPQGAQGPQGATGATGATGVVAATDPIVYTSGTQTVSANSTSLRTLSRQAATNPLRRWQQAFANARYGMVYGLNGSAQRSADVLVIGDSITEGYGSSTSGAGTTYVRRFAQLLAETANTDGRTGTYIACSTFDGLIPGPKWSIGAGSPTEQTFGLGRRGQGIPAGGDMRLTVTGTSATVFYRRVKIFPFPYNNGAIRIRAYAGTGIGGTLLFDRTEDTFDAGLTPGGHLVVAQQIPVAAWGARGTVTLRVTQETSSDGKTGGVLCEGAYIHDGTETIGTRVWASGKTGSAFATWNDSFDQSLLDNWSGILSSHYTIADASAAPVLNTAVGYLNPQLVVIALGSNENSTTPAAIKTAMGNLVTNIQSTPAGFNTFPSFAFMVNPTNGTKTDAYWSPIVTAMYEKAEELGCAIWDWSSLFGPYSTSTTDPYGWSADNLHPNNGGHIALGDFAAQQALAGVSAVTGTEGLVNSISATAPATFDANTRTIAVTTGTTSATGVVQLTDSTTSTSTSTAATPNAVKTAIDRIEESQNHPSGGFDVIPRTSTIGGVALSASNAQLTFFTVPSAMTVSQISYAVAATVSSGLTRGRFGLYSFDGTTVTLLARTDSDTTVFNSANTVYTRSFSTTGGYPATYDLVPGVRYAIAVLVNGTTAGNLAAVSITPNTVAALTPRMNASITLSGADLPATSSSLNNTTFLAWGRVS